MIRLSAEISQYWSLYFYSVMWFHNPEDERPSMLGCKSLETHIAGFPRETPP